MCILDHLQALLHTSSFNVFAVVSSNRHVKDILRPFMFLYDNYSSLQRRLVTTQILPYLTPPIIYDFMTRASLLHEPIIRYPAQEEWAS